MAYNPKWNVLNRIIDADTRIAVIDDVSDSRAFVEIDGTQVADFKAAGLQLATGSRVNEFSIDGTLSGDSDTAIPTEAAVKTYVDTQIANLNPDKIWEGDSYVEVVDDGTNAGYVSIVADGVEVANLSDATQRFGQADDTNITITDSTAVVPSGSVEAFGITEDGIYVENGVTVNDFSNDGTLADASATALPTEYAVKTYVDAQIGGAADKIFEGDSYVEVVDDGTNSGYVTVVTDGVEVAHFDADATTQRIGKASGAGRVNVTDTEVTTHIGTTEVLDLTAGVQRMGVVGDSYLDVTQATDTISAVANVTTVMTLTDTSQTLGGVTGTNVVTTAAGIITMDAATTEVVNLQANTQQIGVSADTFLLLTQDTNTVDLRANNVSILNATDTTQRFGASGDTNLTLNTSADTFSLSAGANTQISGGLTSMTLGVAGDTNITLAQATDSITVNAGNETQLLIETTGVSVYEDLTVTGNLYVDGTTWVVHNQEVTTSDNIIVINNGEVGPGVTSGIAGIEIDRGTLTDYRFVFAENTDTFRIGEIGSTQAVATREDSPVDLTVPWWDDTDKQFKTAGDTAITIDTTGAVIAFTVGASQIGTFEADGLTLGSGTNINEFSIDGTLAGDSDNAVPTEKAVKAYVDAQIGGSADKIWEGDSYVEVVDDGTDAGYITIVADGVEVAHYDALSSTQRMGKASGAARITTSDSAIIGAIAAQTHLTINSSYSQLGNPTDTAITLNSSGNTAQISAGGVYQLTLTNVAATLGQTTASNFSVDSSGATLTADAGTTEVLNMTATSQSIGVSGDTNIVLNQTADSITFTAANGTVASMGTSGLTLASGATVNAISTDSALGSSDTTLITQAAATTYIDAGDSTTYINAVAYADAGDASTLSSANSYADGVAATAESNANSYTDSGLADATAYIDIQDAAVLSDAQAYTDQEINTLRSELDLINVKYVYSDTTAISGDVLLVDTTAGDVNIELLEGADSKIVVKKVTTDGNDVIISTTPGTIDGKASVTIDTGYQAYHFVSDGSDYFIL